MACASGGLAVSLDMPATGTGVNETMSVKIRQFDPEIARRLSEVSSAGSWNRTSCCDVSRMNHAVAWILARASHDHLSEAALLLIDRTVVMPASVATTCVLDWRRKPRNMPTHHQAPMLPWGLLAGPFDGSLTSPSCESEHLLAEWPAARALPWRESVCGAAPGGERRCSVLQKQWD